eukprot:SAG31_NODE_8767_length_1391_cov_1.606811_1_plen_136_part_00
MVDLHWATISNTDAIAINQDYAGHSGSLFAQATEQTVLHGCDWKAGVSCAWPKWTAWQKPLSKNDLRGSTHAILLINNDYEPARLGFKWADVPGLGRSDPGRKSEKNLFDAGVRSCDVYDVWNKEILGTATGTGY